MTDTPLPGFEDADLREIAPLAKGQCLEISNGQRCRYYVGDHRHTFGGGLGDPVSNRHCVTPDAHDPHAWTDEKAWFNCSGRSLETRKRSVCIHCGDPIEYHRADRDLLAGKGHPWWAHADGRIYCGPQYGTDKGADPPPLNEGPIS